MAQETFREIVNLVLTRADNLLTADVKTWINERIRQVTDRRNWSWLDAEGVFSLVDDYTTGTVTVTEGSTTVTGDSTVWTSAMVGRLFRVGTNRDYYLVSAVGGNTDLTLDANYEQSTASGSSYALYAHRYNLASDCAVVYRVWIPRTGKKMQQVSDESINRTFSGRVQTGDPVWWAHVSSSDAGVEQIEVYPLPNRVLTLRYQYRKRLTTLTLDTDTIPQDMRADTIANGVLSYGYRQMSAKGNQAAPFYSQEADKYELLFERGVAEMEKKDHREGRSKRIRLARQYTSHRLSRNRGVLDDWQPWTESID
jgi:hypothetical protein